MSFKFSNPLNKPLKPIFNFRSLKTMFESLSAERGDLKSVSYGNAKIDTYINIDYKGKPLTLYGKAIPAIIEWIRNGGMISVQHDTIYFKVIVRKDGSASVYGQYNQIIGSRLLANIWAKSVPKPKR